MSSQSRRNRNTRGGTRAAGASGKGRWVKGGGAAVLVLVLALVATSRNDAGRHPTPRAGMDHAAHVLPAARYEALPRVASTYELVAAIPMVVDGIYCYCRCTEHSGHYSLLDCFASDHAAGCDICLSEAAIAYRMSEDGEGLQPIRAEIDRRFGG